MVILPVLFLPPELLTGNKRDRSGFVFVSIEKSGATLNLCPGVRGLIFFTAIGVLVYNGLLLQPSSLAPCARQKLAQNHQWCQELIPDTQLDWIPTATAWPGNDVPVARKFLPSQKTKYLVSKEI